ncbi:hypothetical protein [Sphaerisporangium dianthi]|uniref:ABM domain-containing protein n=1 Tax=Sphaerisporangium dianthi TaxID=1436120 RepID=A0ABV9CM69_9ACTN
MSVVQILEYDTKRAGEVETLMNEWRTQTQSKSPVKHEIVAKHHARSDHYMAILEFPTYEDAQRSNKLPETDQFTARMAELCEGTIAFVDYDVIRDKS